MTRARPLDEGETPAEEVCPQPRRAFVEHIMGMPMSVHVRGPEAGAPVVRSAVEAAFARLRHDDLEFSTYRPDSAVSRIRRGELTAYGASRRMREVVTLCEEAAHRTDGAFSAWLPEPPPSLEDTPVFDPTGLVKGWAVEQTFTRLLADLDLLGAHDALMSAGGDIVVACARVDTPDWQVAVEDPADRRRTLTTMGLRRGGVATSGTAARGQHIRDPRSGRAATGLLSATVVGPSLAWADVYATALFACGGEAPWFTALLRDHAALLAYPDGHTETLQQPG